MSNAQSSSDRIPINLRTEALEQLLVERGLVDPQVMDTFIKTYEKDVGPLNGAQVVAKAWTDPEFKQRLLEDGTGAVAELGFKGPQGEHLVVVENSSAVHNVVVCTLCSCYPWPLLGLRPLGTKIRPIGHASCANREQCWLRWGLNCPKILR